MAAGKATRAGARARLPRQRTGQGDPLRRLRPDAQRRLGERGHRPRHGRVCGREHPPLVARDGAAAYPQGTAPADHRRRRRQQRLSLRVCGSGHLQELADEIG